ncbi:MAG: hypothetical protein JWO42_3783, partial [Chloroflexi bacterium]|nr:hypothetical protein [Chloroflexota bacterium]
MGKHALVRAMLLVLAVAALSAGLAAVNNARDAVHLGLILEANSGKVLIVESGSAAANAGLRAGDVVTAIGGLPSGGNPTVISGLLPVSIKQG